MAIPKPGKPVRGSKSGKPIMALFDLLGRRWAMGIIWQLSDRPLAFTELQKQCTSISPTILSGRLKDLAEAGFVQRVLDGYRLTPLGEKLFDILQPFRELVVEWEQSISQAPLPPHGGKNCIKGRAKMKYSIGELLYFSPTKTTKLIVESIAEGFGSRNHQHLDASYADVSQNKVFSADEICVIGSPVYAGRLPAHFLSRMDHVKGNGRYAVLVVVYGNRDFEDALVELFDFALAHDFKPIAAGAFIGEHSYSTAQFPLSQGRPDASDIAKAIEFGRSVLTKLDSGNPDLVVLGAAIPGNHPYKPIPLITNLAPATDPKSCNDCQSCVGVCPVQAILAANPSVSDSNACIRCCACIKVCPVSARSMVDQRIVQIIKRLFASCTTRKEPLLIGTWLGSVPRA